MTTDEYRTHMTLWAMLGAPLISGTDLRSISPTDLAILTNAEAIAINQDMAGTQANRISHNPSLDLWVKTLSTGSAIAIINRGEQSSTYLLNGEDFGIDNAQLYEVWTKQTVSLPHSFTVPAHGCALLTTLKPMFRTNLPSTIIFSPGANASLR
jgi:alpha-galactosidase